MKVGARSDDGNYGGRVCKILILGSVEHCIHGLKSCRPLSLWCRHAELGRLRITGYEKLFRDWRKIAWMEEQNEKLDRCAVCPTSN